MRWSNLQTGAEYLYNSRGGWRIDLTGAQRAVVLDPGPYRTYHTRSGLEWRRDVNAPLRLHHARVVLHPAGNPRGRPTATYVPCEALRGPWKETLRAMHDAARAVQARRQHAEQQAARRAKMAARVRSRRASGRAHHPRPTNRHTHHPTNGSRRPGRRRRGKPAAAPGTPPAGGHKWRQPPIQGNEYQCLTRHWVEAPGYSAGRSASGWS